MKKTLFFMIFIFATAFCGYAQEAPAAEQNDDSELILRYQNRRTMRGYKMLFEAGYQWGLPDKEGFLCGVYDPDKWSVGASAGFQFNNFVFLGGGTDFQLYRSGGNTYLTVPVFGELRINVLNAKKFTPFGDVRFWLRHRRYPRCVCRIPSGSALLTSEAPCNLPAVPV